ncbi:hypothetical protein M413DRAFT_437855 [Hebeloma cylindrosporum]|uniref:Uncharacterized protein n=1 Tax=Hebeloma cylindrosporum TaxID=76867 RepID=A0A0C3CXY5_HEBCY|nr:hypothetical protein M413DRAFT_437855 [Hebeloma cylindrosporum h7]
MKLSFTIVGASISLALARERPVDPIAHRRYASGEVMGKIMAIKEATWEGYRQSGYFDGTRYRSSNAFSACLDGYVKMALNETTQRFQCKNLDVTGHLTHSDLGSTDENAKIGSSIWGYTIDGREFVAVGQRDGAAFAEVVGKGWWNYVPFIGKAEGSLDYIGRLPHYSVASLWREIRDYKGRYAIIGSEAVGHGIQIFDMRKLLDVRPSWNRLSTKAKLFDIVSDSYHFADLPVGRTHNVVSAAASNHIISVGAQPRNDTCRSGLIFIDLTDIANPKRTGCAADDGYFHDAQCLIYHGPDKKYEGTEICYGYNEDSLTIYNITDKTATNIISKTSYDGATYTHQGWVLDTNNQAFLLMDDELDEVDKKGAAADQHATTLIWNITSLENPILSGTWKSDSIAIDHNQYVKNFFSYQSNYGSGLRILDVASIPIDPTGAGIKEVAFLDIFPEDDNITDSPEFIGSWHNYPYFSSGHIVLNTYDKGAFVVKRSKKVTGGVRAQF